jgi:hypothetical protein
MCQRPKYTPVATKSSYHVRQRPWTRWRLNSNVSLCFFGKLCHFSCQDGQCLCQLVYIVLLLELSNYWKFEVSHWWFETVYSALLGLFLTHPPPTNLQPQVINDIRTSTFFFNRTTLKGWVDSRHNSKQNTTSSSPRGTYSWIACNASFIHIENTLIRHGTAKYYHLGFLQFGGKLPAPM